MMALRVQVAICLVALACPCICSGNGDRRMCVFGAGDGKLPEERHSCSSFDLPHAFALADAFQCRRYKRVKRGRKRSWARGQMGLTCKSSGGQQRRKKKKKTCLSRQFRQRDWCLRELLQHWWWQRGTGHGTAVSNAEVTACLTAFLSRGCGACISRCLGHLS
ncbi:hypothetical protein F441_12120 [Phytophthora nicotianae CJ01A1]|uniref:RxLR effector protein n=1 Tax=Phytophthora nicotianae CJ01A1 TaxID=1317063 RepID=W2WPM8_PHYNI|nr:hypothetical protein F441_12120 [Phytophthora nicotianae CJ01A1]